MFQQNFLTTAALDNYLLKSVWDEAFEVTTVNGVRVLNVKLDIAGLKGISAYGLGSTSGSGASGSLGELVNVGQWADEVPTADRVMVQLAGATHWSAKPLADLVGLDTAALAQYLTANSYLKASDISSYLTWANLSGKPTVYPTSWELVVGRPTKLSDLTDDVVAGAESQVRYSRAQRHHSLCGRLPLRRVFRCVGRSGGRGSDQSCLRGHSQVQRDAFRQRAGLVHRRGFVVGSDHRKA